MNPTQYIKNFRDAGESVNLLMGKAVLHEKRLYRGGRLNAVFTHKEMLNIPTILNLRSGKDKKKFEAVYLHVPATDKLENYDTKNRNVKKWINKVIGEIVENEVELPILLHCTSGKDRTAVVVATILKALEIDEPIIIEEYLLSDGVLGASDIKRALEGLSDIESYLKSGYVERLRGMFCDEEK